MSKHFLLYWLTESGCNLGTPLEAEQLDPAIRERVLALTNAESDAESDALTLRLPFFDRRESRRRAEILRGLNFIREHDVIRSLPATPTSALRDYAATLVGTHPAWLGSPRESHQRYFQTWQRVSLALQKALREWIPEFHFTDTARYEDRNAAYPLLVYAASRICRGRPRTEFTYDLADPEVLPRAMHMIGRSLQTVLAGVESRLHAAGKPELARRYAPVWHEDVLRAVRKNPRGLIALLGGEAVLINTVIDLGTARRMEAIRPFARIAHAALRNIYGEDLRPLAAKLLETTTATLEIENGRTATRRPPVRELPKIANS
jgi:hypothetical protein